MITRRSLFRWLGLAGAGAAGAASCKLPPPTPDKDPTGLAVNKPYVPGAETYSTGEERWMLTSCAQCPAGCGIRVRVVEGRAVRIEGNPANPLNQGGIGPRGISGLQALYDADRITSPLVREGGRLIPIKWEAALELLTARLQELRRKRAPERLMVMSGRERGFVHELMDRFCRAFGSPNLVDGSPSRTGVLQQTMLATVGTYALPAYDWGRVDYVLTLEAGLLEDSCQAVYFTRSAAALHRDRIGFRAKIVHAGPAFDLAAHNADEWLQIYPGSSGALALGLCHVLMRDGLHDRGFVEEHCVGTEAFTAFVQGFAPDRVAELTGAPAEIIERVAHELAASRPCFVVADERALTFSNGDETAAAALALNGLLGAIGRKAGGLMLEPAPPYAPWPEVAPDAIATQGLSTARLDQAGSDAFPLARSIHETLPAVFAGPNRPEVLLLYHANPAYSRQQPTAWREALAQVPFVVSFSPFRDETVEAVAHLVLPDRTYLERWEDAGAAPGLGRAVAGIRRPVVEPLHDTRSTGDVMCTVARALGEGPAAAFPWDDFRAAMEERLLGLHRARRGTILGNSEREFLQRLYDDGFWADLETEPIAIEKVVFRSEWTEPEWEGDPSKFPLKLIAYRPLGYAEGSGANQPWLRHLRSLPNLPYWATPATLHPESARPGLHDGDQIALISPWGSVVAPIRLDKRMLPGYVALPLGGGHSSFGRWAKGLGTNALALLRPGPAQRTGANLLGGTRVRIERRRNA